VGLAIGWESIAFRGAGLYNQQLVPKIKRTKTLIVGYLEI